MVASLPDLRITWSNSSGWSSLSSISLSPDSAFSSKSFRTRSSSESDPSSSSSHHRRRRRHRRHPCLIHPRILFVCDWHKRQRLCQLLKNCFYEHDLLCKRMRKAKQVIVTLRWLRMLCEWYIKAARKTFFGLHHFTFVYMYSILLICTLSWPSGCLPSLREALA